LFTNYLSQISEEWRKKVGQGTSVAWPVGSGGKGNEGVLQEVKMFPGSIGHVELSYAAKANVPDALLQNKAGHFVRASRASFSKAAASADWSPDNRFYLILTNQPQPDAWPITGASYILIKNKAQDIKLTRALLAFFQWGFSEAGKSAIDDLNYVALPDSVITKIAETWSKTIKGQNGETVWP
jgi:phosphate transport system substrate-binding protein